MSESSLTIISPTTFAEAKELSTYLSNANTMPAALKKSPADVLAIVMAGAELGLAPMQAIRGIHLIEGKPTLSADAMGALVKASPKCEYLQCTVTTDKIATFVTKRVGDPEPTTLSFTIEEANLAGLNRPTQSGKPSNWTKFPKAMLRARAQSAICRLVYSDLMLGVYDPDELEADAPRIEKHVESTVVATVESLKADLKAKKAPKPTPPPRASVAEDERCVGWGKNADLVLADLDDDKVRWYVANAEEKASANEGNERDVWVDRLLRYTTELAKRGIAEMAVSP